MGAAILATPELALEKDEANMLAQASADVLRHYPGFTPAVEVTDWIGLITVAGMIYGPRFMAIRNRRRKTATAQASDAASAPVVDFNAMRAAANAAKPAPQKPTVTPPKTQATGSIEIPGLPGVSILRPAP